MSSTICCYFKQTYTNNIALQSHFKIVFYALCCSKLIYVRMLVLILKGNMYVPTISMMSAFWKLMVHSFNFVEINLATKGVFSKIKHSLQKVILFSVIESCV